MAVMTKLMPVVSNLSNDPTSPPTVAPETQYNWFSRVTKNINQPLSGISNFSHELRLGYVACTKHRHDNIKFRKGIRDLLLMIMLYDTGARIQELLNLKICDIQFPKLCEGLWKRRQIPVHTGHAQNRWHCGPLLKSR